MNSSGTETRNACGSAYIYSALFTYYNTPWLAHKMHIKWCIIFHSFKVLVAGAAVHSFASRGEKLRGFHSFRSLNSLLMHDKATLYKTLDRDLNKLLCVTPSVTDTRIRGC